jgi:hypothetical protein
MKLGMPRFPTSSSGRLHSSVPSHIQERVQAYRTAGVSYLIAEPFAQSHAERVEHVAILKERTG